MNIGGFDDARFRLRVDRGHRLGDQLRRRGPQDRARPGHPGLAHLKVWTLRSMVWTDFARRGVPWVALQVRNRLSAALNLGWRHRMSALACVVALAAVWYRRPARRPYAVGAFLALNHAFYRVLWRRAAAGPAWRSASGCTVSITSSQSPCPWAYRHGDEGGAVSRSVRLGLVGCGRLAAIRLRPRGRACPRRT